MTNNTQELLKLTIQEVDNIESGEIFLLKDLFKGYEWSRLDNTTKRTLGTIFLSWATNSDKIAPYEKTAQSQQRYIMRKL